MRWLVVLVAMIVAPVSFSVPAGSHDWYTGLRSPDGMSCCNERDCRPVAYRINPDTGREEIKANGAWHHVEYDKVLPFSSPDGGSHACWGEAAGRPVFRCIILPGMAFIAPSEGLASNYRTHAWRRPRLRPRRALRAAAVAEAGFVDALCSDRVRDDGP
jgi:hypothetical protein